MLFDTAIHFILQVLAQAQAQMIVSAHPVLTHSRAHQAKAIVNQVGLRVQISALQAQAQAQVQVQVLN